MIHVRWPRVSLALVLGVALFAAACGGGEAPPGDDPDPDPNGTNGNDNGEELTDWDEILEAAQNETLHAVTHPGSDYEALIAAFQEAYPEITVEHLGARPSEFAPRVIEEQRNNIYAWDLWTTSTSNMNNVVMPTGAFVDINPYLVLDEVTEPANWRPGELLFTSDNDQILIHSLNVSQAIRINTEVLDDLGVELTSLEQLIDPELRGMIAFRDLSGQHGSSLQMTGLLHQYGEDFVRTLLTDQEPRVQDDARLIADNLIRGEYAVTIGAANEVIDECWNAGGCQEIEALQQNNYALARGVAVFENAPSPNATKVFINWFLGQDGQQEFVDIWGELASDGGHSVRADVEPASGEGHQLSFPDFDNLDQYTLQGTDFGAPLMEQIQEMWEELR